MTCNLLSVFITTDNHYSEHRSPEARIKEGGDLGHRRGNNSWPVGLAAAHTSALVGEYPQK